jgi:Lrp/AsnC family transcriptional regulator
MTAPAVTAPPPPRPARPETLDRIDRRILHELQRDASLSLALLSGRVGLSQTPCWKRVQKLERAGVITGRAALVDPAAVGLGLTVFVAVEARDHSPAWRDEFAAAMSARPEVLEIHRLAGGVDYMLKVVMPDMPAFDRFYLALTRDFEPRNVTSHFAMERLKATVALPIDTVTP